ncbi:MAG: sugar transferase [Acidobacteriota bacterium]
MTQAILAGRARENGDVAGGLGDAVQRAFDIAVAGLGVLVLWPLLATVALAVLLVDGRPVLWLDRRTGRWGREFVMYKFRTMVRDAARRGGLSTARNDPRVTRLGRLLRRYKLDEMPQLFNVLRGEMSIVGPRPEKPQYTRLYTEEQQVILSVRPGLTDYASIKLVNQADLLGDEDVDQAYMERVLPLKNELRVLYVRERSWAGDLKILARTPVAIVRGHA